MSNKGIDQIRFLLPDNPHNAGGWKYGLTNNSPVNRDYTQYSHGQEKHHENNA